MGATVRIQATVNGERRESEVEARTLLVHWLRDELGPTAGCTPSRRPSGRSTASSAATARPA
jgi:hypothetical protein